MTLDINSRLQTTYYLRSLIRVSKGLTQTKYESKIKDTWDSISVKDRKYILKRISTFCSLPLSLQEKFIDPSILYLKLDSIILWDDYFTSDETAGKICGDSRTFYCNDNQELGNVIIPGSSQSIAIDDSRPIAALALGENGLVLVNISIPIQPTLFNPSEPRIINNETGFVNDVEFLENYLIAITSNRLLERRGSLELITSVDPTSTSQVSHLIGDYFKLCVDKSKKLIFSFNRSEQKLQIIDYSMPNNISLVRSVNLSVQVADLSYENDILQVFCADGSSTFYKLIQQAPTWDLVWIGSDVLYCGTGNIDNSAESTINSAKSYIARDGELHLINITPSGPIYSGTKLCISGKVNSLLIINEDQLIADVTDLGQIAGSNPGSTVDCVFPSLVFFNKVESQNPTFESFHEIRLRNEIKGIKLKNNILYVADNKISLNCKAPGHEPLKFRIYTFPKPYLCSTDINPKINLINGQNVYESIALPNQYCGSDVVFCSNSTECGPTGYCVGGICARLPIINLGLDDELVLAGENYWDIGAQVLIKNFETDSWISFDAQVNGNEYCDLLDRMKVKLDASVSYSGRKSLKIRNYNSYDINTCCECNELSAGNCSPDYFDSKEFMIYLQNGVDQSKPGFELSAVELKARRGSNGTGDLGPHAWYDDETVFVVNDPIGGTATYFLPDEKGFEFKHNGEYKTLNTVLVFMNPSPNDAIQSNMIKLWETDDNSVLGYTLIGAGFTCAGAALLTDVCGPYAPVCLVGCLSISAVGALLVIFDSGDWIAGETEEGLKITKEIASDILQFGECAIPSGWNNESPESINKIKSVSDLQMVGSLKQRYITKEYTSKTSDAIYQIKFRLTERR